MILATQIRRDAATALSVANLTFGRSWNELLTYTKEQSFFFRELPSLSQSIAAAVNVAGLSLLLFGLIRLMRMISRKWGDRWTLLVAPLIILPAFNSIAGIISVVAPTIAPQRLLHGFGFPANVILLAVVCTAAWCAWHWPDRILAVSAALTLNLVLLIPVEVAAIIWHVVTDDRVLYTTVHLAPRLPDKADSTPVLLLLIDELDYRLLFEDRPAGIKLPEFDRLRAQAFSAQRALSPAPTTRISVPSLLTGKRYSKTFTRGPDQLTGEPSSGGAIRPIRGEDTIFASVRELGINTTVVGWYLPYCRIFGSVLSSCTWAQFGSRVNVEGQSFLRDLVNQAQAPYETASYSPFPQAVLSKHRIFNVGHIEQRAIAALSVPSPGFVYVHHMATHAPYVYDRITKTFTKRNSPVSGYVDALAFADIVLGQFRRAMEEGGSWDRAVVLVTSDHFFREAKALDGKLDDRVPWILKMPGTNQRINYHAPIHTIITRRLLEAVLRKEVQTQAEATEWIRTQESRVYAESEWK